MGYRHSSIDEYKVLKTTYELLSVAMMSTPGPEQKKALLNVADYIAKERDAAAIRAAKREGEHRRRARVQKETDTHEQ